ncbi:MAG: NusG domain II-containing protein [Atopostipes sp.]|nr:NusG domain II-containing protein [Atopostipes sp.]
MKKIIKMMKIGDLIIIGLLVIISFLPLAIFANNKSQLTDKDQQIQVVVSVDGEEIHQMELKNDHTRETFLYDNGSGHENLIVRDGDEVYIKEASCPDELCVYEGPINQVGETIVCLPHRLLVEIVSTSSAIEDSGDIDLVS